MGDIIEKRRRYYSGVNADKVNIPAGGKAAGDRYYATDTLVEFTWTGAAWVPLGDDTIDAGMLQTDAVETAKIKNLNVTVGKLAGGITAAKLAADCVETLKIKNLNVTTAKAALGFGRYVPVTDNGWDYTEATVVDDATWKVDALDFTGVVVVGAVAVVLRLSVQDAIAGSYIMVRRDAADGAFLGVCKCQVANISNDFHVVLPIDSNRLMDFWGSNVAFDSIGIAVLGYFI